MVPNTDQIAALRHALENGQTTVITANGSHSISDLLADQVLLLLLLLHFISFLCHYYRCLCYYFLFQDGTEMNYETIEKIKLKRKLNEYGWL